MHNQKLMFVIRDEVNMVKRNAPSHFKIMNYYSVVFCYEKVITHERFGSVGSFESSTVDCLLMVLTAAG